MYNIPEHILDFIKNHFAKCNFKLSESLSKFPGIREESLDNNFISYFSENEGPIKVDKNWNIRFEAHFIGGSRHYKTWEVADIGLMIVFRKMEKLFEVN